MIRLTKRRVFVLFGALIVVSGITFSEMGCREKVFHTSESFTIYRGPVPTNLQEDPKVPEPDKVELEPPSPYKIELEPPSIPRTPFCLESDARLQERIRQENRERKCNPESLCESALQVTQQWQASLNVFGSR